MNRAAIIGLGVALTAIAFAAGFFVHLHLHSKDEGVDSPEVASLKADLQAARQDAVDFATGIRRKLWWDQDAVKAIKMLGYDQVLFFRWQGGAAEGWVEFDAADGPKRFPLDWARSTLDQWAKEGKKLDAKGSKGNLLLALRQIGKSDEFDCELTADFMLMPEADAGGRSTGGGGSFHKKGKVKLEKRPDPSPEITNRFGESDSDLRFIAPFEISVDRYIDKKTVPWVNIKLVDVPK
jgi:hypothetical protein